MARILGTNSWLFDAAAAAVTVAPAPAAPVTAAAAIPAAPLGTASSCIRLQHLFNPADEEGDAWVGEIRTDIVTECQKFGTVKQCWVDPQSPEGLCYVSFHTSAAAIASANMMHGRFFGGQNIVVYFMPEEEFDHTVPDDAP